MLWLGQPVATCICSGCCSGTARLSLSPRSVVLGGVVTSPTDPLSSPRGSLRRLLFLSLSCDRWERPGVHPATPQRTLVLSVSMIRELLKTPLDDGGQGRLDLPFVSQSCRKRIPPPLHLDSSVEFTFPWSFWSLKTPTCRGWALG